MHGQKNLSAAPLLPAFHFSGYMRSLKLERRWKQKAPLLSSWEIAQGRQTQISRIHQQCTLVTKTHLHEGHSTRGYPVTAIVRALIVDQNHTL